MPDMESIKNGDDGYTGKLFIPREGDTSNPNAIRVRNIKDNIEKEIWCSTKQEALDILLSHKGDLAVDTVIQDEYARDDTGVYFIISSDYHRG